MKPLLEARSIAKSFGSHPVLKGISLSVALGEKMAIFGASGVGKSTLLHLLGGLDEPTSGSVLFEGEDLYARPDPEISRLRNETIGFVFQFHHLLPEFNILENVTMPLLLRGISRGEVRERGQAILEKVGLKDRAKALPAELSGGEQQRVAVARAVIGRPKLLLADEPTGNLDRSNGEKVFDLLLETAAAGPSALVVVTHNEELAHRIPVQWRLAEDKLHRVL